MKQAQVTMIITWLLVILGTIIIFFVWRDIYAQTQNIDPEMVACKQQVLQQIRLAETQNQPLLKRMTNDQDQITIACPTQERTLSASNKEESFEQVAQDLVTCKDLWGEGVIFNEEGVYCHVCAYTRFEGGGQLEGLNEFLYEHAYAQMLQGVRSSEQLPDVSEFVHEDSLDTSKEYATIFYHAEGKRSVELFNQSVAKKENVMKAGVITGGTGVAGIAGKVMCTIVSGGWCAAAIGVGAAGGLAASAFTSTFISSEPDYASTVLFVEWSPQAVQDLGCQYAPIQTN